MHMIKQNIFAKAAITGLVLVVVSVIMMIAGRADFSGAWLPQGFKVPILALEFASSAEEVKSIISGLSEDAIHSLRLATQWDMLFLIVYNLFLVFLLSSIYRITQLKQYKWISVFPLVIMLADAMENMQLFNAFDGMDVNIMVLKMATWIKWLGLSIAFIFVGRFLITTGRYYDKVLALATYVSLPIGIYAMISHSAINEVFARLFYLLFPMAVIYTWFSGIKRAV